MRNRTRLLLVVSMAMVAALAAPRVPEVLASVEWFRVDDIRVEGIRYLDAAEVLAAAAIPVGANLWDDVEPVMARLRAHPGIAEARVSRQIPGRLTFEVSEREPVALLPNPALTPVDREGRFLPIDPIAYRLDLPLVHPRRDPEAEGPPLTAVQLRALVTELTRLIELDPDLGATISDVALDAWGDVRVHLESGVRLHYRAPLTPRRLREGLIVLEDARERHPDRPPVAVDLRFVEQVVVRLARTQGR